MKKIFILFAVSCFFAACLPDENLPEEEFYPEEEEPAVNLKLSVDEGPIYTESVDFEFEILEGNGGYTAGASGEEDKDAAVTINGNKVTVNLLRHSAFITITDQKRQSARVEIYSTAESLISHSYNLFMDNGSTDILKRITFGAGGYSIKKKKGDSAEAEMLENDDIKVTALKPGTTYYKIIDRRGTTAPLRISVSASYVMTNNRMTIAAVNEQTAFVTLKWGEGDWTLAEEPSSPCIEKVWLMKKADSEGKYDVLQIDTSENAKGTAMIQLKDKAGRFAFVTVNVR